MIRLIACLAAVAAAFAQTPGEDRPRTAGADLYLANRFQEARTYLETEIASGKAAPESHYWLGYAYLALSLRDKAVAQFEKYLQSKPDDEDVLYAVARTYSELAFMSLQRIFSLDPESARAYQMRGIRFELEKSWQDAIREYEMALKVNPNTRGIHSSIGRIYERELKDAVRAQAAYQKELPPLPPDSPGEAAKGIRKLEEKRIEESLPHLLRWREAEPSNPDVYYYLGEAFTDLKVKAIQRLKTASPNSYRLHQILAENYASIHRKPEAIAEYRKVIALQPQLPGAHYELARLSSDTDPEEAVKLLRKELAIDPLHYAAKSLLGRLHVALDRPAEAIPLLRAALEAKPDLLDARKALGRALVNTKEPAEALPHLRAVEDANPDDEQIHFLLSQAYRMLGKNVEAAREMQLHQQTLRKLARPDQGLGNRTN
ncbi:MAG: tetratricopeptide repeat protein [Bryobacteraceae bacterium]